MGRVNPGACSDIRVADNVSITLLLLCHLQREDLKCSQTSFRTGRSLPDLAQWAGGPWSKQPDRTSLHLPGICCGKWSRPTSPNTSQNTNTYRNTKLFNFMQWNLFTSWRLAMWQQFRETIICKLSLIIKARTETSIPGLKPVSLWFSRGRQDQEFKTFLSAGSQVQLYISVIHKDWQSLSLKLLPQADCISRAKSVAPSLSLLQNFWDLVLCTIINAHLCLRAPF